MWRSLWLVFPILGIILRVINLSSFPAGFTPDEAAFGYNAYSLLVTGHDEWTVPFYKLPIYGLRSFGDYKLPLYAFLDVPLVSFFGLHETSVRFPNALLSILTLPLIYILARKLFPTQKIIAKLAVIFFSFSPWSIPLSRGAFEANLSVFFLSLWLVLLTSRKFVLSAIILALGMYSYHSARLIALPLFVFSAIFFIAGSENSGRKIGDVESDFAADDRDTKPRPSGRGWLVGKSRTGAVIVFLLLSLPALLSLVKFNARSADISIFNPADGWAEMAQNRLNLINSGWPAPLARLAANKLTATGKVFFVNYISYFSPRFLFTSGPGESTYGMLPGRGVTYVLDVIFLPLGLWFIVKSKSKLLWSLLLVALLAPIPAAATKGAGFAANRAAPLILPLVLVSAVGAGYLWQKSTRILVRGSLALVFFSLALTTFMGFVRDLPNLSAHAMGYGWRAALEKLLPSGQGFSEIRISRSLSEPHIYLAFYTSFPPRDYQLASQNWADFEIRGFKFLDQYNGYWLGNFRFGDLNFDHPVNFPVLYVGRPQDFPSQTNYKILSVYPDGRPAIVMVAKSRSDSLTFRL